MSYRDYENEQPEHECPRALEECVEEFDVGGQFLSPAGRWESIIDRTPHAEQSVRITVHSTHGGREFCWTFWARDKFAYIPGWKITPPRHVVVFESASVLDVEVTEARTRTFGGGYTLLTARQVRGTGWVITDVPDGKTVEYVTLPSKARARSEVNRRARAHSKRLGVPLHKPDSAR